MSEIGVSSSESVQIDQRLPIITQNFNLLSQIGSGTFSKVYLAQLKTENDPEVETEMDPVAIKIITPCSDPNRVFREISILKRANGLFNIIPLVSCYICPQSGTGAIIMPFVKHKPFSEYFDTLNLSEIRMYIKSLLLSLRHLHSLGILHRDIKPPNFLFDPKTGFAKLVDFGLSEDIRYKFEIPSDTSDQSRFSCSCTNYQVCKMCLNKRSQKASRAGTGGFRPPEVLLKYPKQDQKLDIWAAGVCLLTLLSRRYPYFPAVDDSMSLIQISALLGKSSLIDAAISLGKKLTFVGIPDPSHSLGEIVRLQRQSSSGSKTGSVQSDGDESNNIEWRHVIQLLTKLLTPNPKKRPDAKDALKMDFFILYS